MAEPTDIERLVGELELAVDRVRSLYEQYFMGIEKLEPTVPRKDVDRRIHTLRKEQIRNTAQRFRFQMIVQRYNTYQTHWQRICREIESGTYKRHLIRAQRRFGAPREGSVRPPPGAELSRELAEELAELDREFAPADPADHPGMAGVKDAPRPALSVPRPAPPRPGPPRPASTRPEPPRPASTRPEPPRPAPPSRPASSRPEAPRPGPPAPLWRKAPAAVPTAPGAPPPAPSAVGRLPTRPQALPPAPLRGPPVIPAAPLAQRPPEDLPEERVRAIYSQYVEAKRRQNESTAAITYDAVAKSLRDSGARLREKHGRRVDFEVAVKDGKAILKPVLK